MIQCAKPECTATVNEDRWSKIRCGWFFSRETGEAYCPPHIPEWVHKWRREQRYEACLEHELDDED